MNIPLDLFTGSHTRSHVDRLITPSTYATFYRLRFTDLRFGSLICDLIATSRRCSVCWRSRNCAAGLRYALSSTTLHSSLDPCAFSSFILRAFRLPFREHFARLPVWLRLCLRSRVRSFSHFPFFGFRPVYRVQTHFAAPRCVAHASRLVGLWIAFLVFAFAFINCTFAFGSRTRASFA